MATFVLKARQQMDKIQNILYHKKEYNLGLFDRTKATWLYRHSDVTLKKNAEPVCENHYSYDIISLSLFSFVLHALASLYH